MSFDPEVEKINKKKFEEMLQQRMRDQGQGNQEEGGNSPVGKPITLTDKTFPSEVQKHAVMVVDFWASWCGPCKLVAPVIEELATEFAGKVVFGKLNVDENPVTSENFGIQSIPTILVFKNGTPVDGVIGAVPKSQIVSKFSRYVGNSNMSPYR
jgi:thioredoxin 1